MDKGIIYYFSLWSEEAVFGVTGSVKRREFKLFLGVLLGALSEVLYSALTSADDINFVKFLIALIASVVVFPTLYYQGGLNKGALNFTKFCLAFQNGFFWSVTMASLNV